MINLEKVLLMVQSDRITAEDSFLIDDALRYAKPEQIPLAQAPAVMHYIDLRLGHNTADVETRQQLERLYEDLQARVEAG